jgi:hypothetical protein
MNPSCDRHPIQDTTQTATTIISDYNPVVLENLRHNVIMNDLSLDTSDKEDSTITTMTKTQPPYCPVVGLDFMEVQEVAHRYNLLHNNDDDHHASSNHDDSTTATTTTDMLFVNHRMRLVWHKVLRIYYDQVDVP